MPPCDVRAPRVAARHAGDPRAIAVVMGRPAPAEGEAEPRAVRALVADCGRPRRGEARWAARPRGGLHLFGRAGCRRRWGHPLELRQRLLERRAPHGLDWIAEGEVDRLGPALVG